MDVKNSDVSGYELFIKYRSKNIGIWICLLISLITAMISILSTTKLDDSRTSTVFIVFIAILIIMSAVYVYGISGVFSAALSSFLFCMSIHTSIWGIILNICANTLQAIIIWIVFKYTKTDEETIEMDGVTDYKFLLFVIGLTYIICSFVFNRYLMFYIFIVLLTICVFIFSIKDRNIKKLKFFLFVAIIPSCLGGALNATNVIINAECRFALWYESFSTWFFSNSILFGTFGYLLLNALRYFKNQSVIWQQNQKSSKQSVRCVELKVSTVMFYVATFLWNILFYIMYMASWLDRNTVLYLFPWTVGNIFFLLNLLLSSKSEIKSGVSPEDAFKWFESRAIVAEQNTQILIAVITFLLPLSANYLDSVTTSISFLFVLNITTAVISVGLIWIPKENVKLMEAVKNLKTIFHLFTMSLLLLNAVMIINAVV